MVHGRAESAEEPACGGVDRSPPAGAAISVLASGSRGNCSLLRFQGADGCAVNVLIDLGLSPRRTVAELSGAGLDLDGIDGVLLTHLDHDHCHSGWFEGLPRHAEVFLHRTHRGRAYRSGFNSGRVLTFTDEPFELRSGLRVAPLLTFHDSLGAAAFRIEPPAGGGLGGLGAVAHWSLGFATDLGRVEDALTRHLAGVEVLALESNYCPGLQRASNRPAFLKRRIMGGRGHLSNQEALEAARRIAPRRHLIALHLSQQCNQPELVRELHAGSTYALTVAMQATPTEWVRLGLDSPAPGAVGTPTVGSSDGTVPHEDPNKHQLSLFA